MTCFSTYSNIPTEQGIPDDTVEVISPNAIWSPSIFCLKQLRYVCVTDDQEYVPFGVVKIQRPSLLDQRI